MVDAEQVVEDLGVAAVVLLHLPDLLGLLVDDRLDTAGDVDEGALQGVAQRVLAVDHLEHLADQHALGVGEFAPFGMGVDDLADHLIG